MKEKEVTKSTLKTAAKHVAFLALYIFIFYITNALCNGIAVQIAVTSAFAAFR